MHGQKVCAFANRAVRLGGLTTATFTTAGVVEEGKLQRRHKGQGGEGRPLDLEETISSWKRELNKAWTKISVFTHRMTNFFAAAASSLTSPSLVDSPRITTAHSA